MIIPHRPHLNAIKADIFTLRCNKIYSYQQIGYLIIFILNYPMADRKLNNQTNFGIAEKGAPQARYGQVGVTGPALVYKGGNTLNVYPPDDSTGQLPSGKISSKVNFGTELIKGESKIQYVPFERKIIEYQEAGKAERVPKKRVQTQYKEERRIETIPREVTVTDYYAVEYLRQYIPQIISEKKIEYVKVPKKQVRYEYLPVQRQIVHYPEQELEASDAAIQTGRGQQQAYQATQAEYQTSQAGYQANQAGYQASQAGYQTNQAGYQASQAGYQPGQAGQVGYNAQQTSAIQSGSKAGGQNYTATTIAQNGNVSSSSAGYTPGQTYEYVNAPTPAYLAQTSTQPTIYETSYQYNAPQQVYTSNYQYPTSEQTYSYSQK